jgi:predicted RNA-binding Zn ribbon-like protein
VDLHHFELVAGVLCLDFVNTVGDRVGTWRYARNDLQRYEDVVSWARQAEALTERESAAMYALAFKRPEAARAALTRAVELRETLHALFAPIAGERVIRRPALTAFNPKMASLLARSRLIATPNGCRWAFDAAGAQDLSVFDRVAWSVTRSAIDLLTSADLRHVHQCASETCGWLFLDVSKNKTRRWCAMKMCGNKAKVRHHRAMQQEGENGESDDES